MFCDKIAGVTSVLDLLPVSQCFRGVAYFCLLLIYFAYLLVTYWVPNATFQRRSNLHVIPLLPIPKRGQ